MSSTRAPSALRKAWRVLTRKQRRGAIFIFCLSVIGMTLETLGIGLVIPAVALLTQADLGSRYPFLVPVLDRLGNPEQGQLIAGGMLFLLVVYAFKGLFLAFFAWRQMRFVFRVQADLAQRIFAGYLHQPYAFHLQRNSAQLIRNALNETNLFSQTVLMAALDFAAQSLVLLGISTLLVAVEPRATLVVVAALGSAGWAYKRGVQEHLSRWGADRQVYDGLRIQDLQEGLGGAKEVKLLGREDDFLARFKNHSAGYARVGERHATLGRVPPLGLELLAVVGLSTLVAFMLGQGKPVDSVLPAAGLFAIAAFRLLPAANRVIGATQNIRYGLPAVDTVYSEVRLLENTQAPKRGLPVPFRTELCLDQVTFRYPSRQTPTLHEITLRIPRGASVGLVGTTGAGKSTLVDVLLGLLTPESGRVVVDGVDINEAQRGWQDQIGYVPQTIFLTDDSLRRNVAFGIPGDQIDDDAVRRAIRGAQLEALVDDLPEGLDTPVGERGVRLSGGQRQRVGIARALYHEPSVLVLDEATSALDTVTEHDVMGTVGALHGEKTIIIVSHRLSTVEHCDRLFRVSGGRVVAEGAAALRAGQPVSPKTADTPPQEP